jgi:hypothetical protein
MKGWKRVQPPVTLDEINQKDDRAQKNVAYKQKTRDITLRNMGLSLLDPRLDIRCCNLHKIEKLYLSVCWTTIKNKEKISKMYFNIPVHHGLSTNEGLTEVRPRENSIARALSREMAQAEEDARKGDKDAALRYLNLIWGGANAQPIVNQPLDYPTRPTRIGVKREEKERRKVVVRMDDLTDTRVHIQTGFPSLLALLGFIAIVNNGDIEEITKTTSSLTWLEEWYLYLEIVYGKSISRWVDACDKYGMSDRRLREIFDNKLDAVLKIRQEWPRYCSLLEDETYHKEVKWDAYKGVRVIMFDNTNIMIRQPTDADAQRCPYSVYYSGNVGKGAVFIQPCGWVGSHEIWTGGVSDSAYMKQSKAVDTLNKYLLSSSSETEETRKVKFTIVLDRGYRILTETYQEGGHMTFQPIFSNADRHFTAAETVHNATVAYDRSGNE